MSSGPLGVPGAKPSLLLSTLLSVLGIGGVMRAIGLLTFTPGAEVDSLIAGEASAALLELMARSDLARAVAGANLLVSALLVIASFVVMLRRPSASWWIQQALLANVLYTLAAIVASFVFHANHAEEMTRIAAMMPQLQEAPADAEMPATWAMNAIAEGCMGVLMLGVYFLIWRLARRPDVQRFVGAEVAQGE